MANACNGMRDPKINIDQLCANCVRLIPRKDTVHFNSKDWGTLKSLSTSASSCSLYAMIAAGRQHWLEAGLEKKEDTDDTTIDDCPLKLTLTHASWDESGIASNKLQVVLSMKVFSYPHFFVLTACSSTGMCSHCSKIKSDFETQLAARLCPSGGRFQRISMISLTA